MGGGIGRGGAEEEGGRKKKVFWQGGGGGGIWGKSIRSKDKDGYSATSLRVSGRNSHIRDWGKVKIRMRTQFNNIKTFFHSCYTYKSAGQKAGKYSEIGNVKCTTLFRFASFSNKSYFTLGGRCKIKDFKILLWNDSDALCWKTLL